MTPHDIKILGECAVLLRQVKNKLIKKSKPVQSEFALERLGAAIAVIDKYARRLEGYNTIAKMQSEKETLS